MSLMATFLAMLKFRCVRCHHGKMFTHSILSPSKFDAMPEHCPKCGLRFERELGFYWGSMYISYGLSVFVVLFIGMGLFYLANDPPTWVYISAVTFAIILLTPVLYRYSRVIMLYLFGGVSYDPQKRGN
jgi:uncharacterized protein (DUF983 family)